MPEISQEELDALQARLELAEERATELEAERRRDEVEDKIAEYAARFGGQPALMKTVRDILLSDDGGPALLLSEDGVGEDVEKLTATDVVDRILSTLEAPKLDLSEDPMHRRVPGDNDAPQDRELKDDSLETKVQAAREYLGV